MIETPMSPGSRWNTGPTILIRRGTHPVRRSGTLVQRTSAPVVGVLECNFRLPGTSRSKKRRGHSGNAKPGLPQHMKRNYTLPILVAFVKTTAITGVRYDGLPLTDLIPYTLAKNHRQDNVSKMSTVPPPFSKLD